MRLFMVRPFGTQDGIDFDLVVSELIFEAAKRLRSQYGLELLGSTTLEINNPISKMTLSRGEPRRAQSVSYGQILQSRFSTVTTKRLCPA